MSVPSISPYNELAPVRAGDGFAPAVQIADITLREGEQASGIAFTRAEKVRLAARVAELGAAMVQVGFAGRDDDVVAAVRAASVPTRLAVVLVGFRGNWRLAAESAARAGADEIQVLFRGADRQLEAMGISREQALSLVAEQVGHCVQVVPAVTFHPSFVTVADEAFARELYAVADDAGATRFGVMDTLGVARPEAIAHLVGVARAATGDGAVDVHCHNDFGLAVANTIAGLRAGASRADTSVNGYGERAGNCPFDELAVALELLYGVETGIDLAGLTALDEEISGMAAATLPPMKAVGGRDAFSQKLDIHVQLAKVDPSLMEPFSPGLVGNRRQLRLGRGTGPHGAREKAAQLGLEPPDEAAAALLAEAINERALASKRAVTDDEFRDMLARERSRR